MSETNSNSRLETFCDGVFAIALTLLIIDIKIPSTAIINTNADLWLALKHIAPSMFAFLLSFIIILVTWVNHHATLKLIHRSSSSFIYANGFLLLIVVFIPFPTSLLGEYLFTDHAAPAVIVYNAVLALQSISWILMSRTAVKEGLTKSEKAARQIQKNGVYGYYSFVLYSLCAILAIWFPLSSACLTTATWIFWLVYGMNIRHEEMN